MSNTLLILKNKARVLRHKVLVYGTEIPKKRMLDFFAYVVGKNSWGELAFECNRKPVHYTYYQLHIDRLQIATNFSYETSKKILEEVEWPSEYTPCFNTFPLTEEGEIIVPRIFICSHIFNLSNKRELCVLKRVSLFDDDLKVDKDRILYTGESLNHYDKKIFYSLLYLHPSDIPVGRSFFLGVRDINVLWDHSYSIRSMESSLDRMRDCRLWIPDLNFFGPLIHSYKKLQKKRGYNIILNSELTKLYYGDSYAQFMDSGNLFHRTLSKEQNSQFEDFRELKSHLEWSWKNNIDKYNETILDPWPTYENDLAAIHAIIAKNSEDYKINFKLIENFESNGDEIRIKLPIWKIQAHQYFVDLYGEEKGEVIFLKSISLFLGLIFSEKV